MNASTTPSQDASRPRWERTAAVSFLAILAVTAWPSQAQTALQIFQAAIQARGNDCEAISKTQPIGTGTSGDALVAVACSSGGRHVVRIRKDNSVSYMSTCAVLESRAGIRCFTPRNTP